MKRFMIKFGDFLYIALALVFLVVFFSLINSMAHNDEQQGYENATTCLSNVTTAANIPNQTNEQVVKDLQTMVGNCDAQPDMYAELFDWQGNHYGTKRTFDKGDAGNNFSAMNDVYFHNYAIQHKSGNMTVAYNKSTDVDLTFKWLPTDAENQYLVVVGKLPTFWRKFYVPLSAAALVNVVVILAVAGMSLFSKLHKNDKMETK